MSYSETTAVNFYRQTFKNTDENGLTRQWGKT